MGDEEQEAAKLEGTAFQVEKTAGINAMGKSMKKQPVTELQMSLGQRRDGVDQQAQVSSTRPHAVL